MVQRKLYIHPRLLKEFYHTLFILYERWISSLARASGPSEDILTAGLGVV